MGVRLSLEPAQSLAIKEPFCSSGRSMRTLSNASIASVASINFCVCGAPSTGAIRSRALATTSSLRHRIARGAAHGLDAFRRAACRRSASISTIATRTGSSSASASSGAYFTLARWRSTAASCMRGLSCAA